MRFERALIFPGQRSVGRVNGFPCFRMAIGSIQGGRPNEQKGILDRRIRRIEVSSQTIQRSQDVDPHGVRRQRGQDMKQIK